MTPENITLFASAARTTSQVGADQFNRGHRGIHIVINATALADTPSVVFTLQGKDETSGTYYTILASAAVTTAAPTQVVLRVFDGALASANLIANDILPATWRLITTAGDADSLTYSVGASLIP